MISSVSLVSFVTCSLHFLVCFTGTLLCEQSFLYHVEEAKLTHFTNLQAHFFAAILSNWGCYFFTVLLDTFFKLPCFV